MEPVAKTTLERISELEQEMHQLRTETGEERRAREEQEWQKQQVRRNYQAQRRGLVGRLEKIGRTLTRAEPWADFLQQQLTDVTKELDASVEKIRTGAPDRWARQQLENRVDDLQRAKRAIMSGGWEDCGDLHERATNAGFDLNGRFSLRKTQRWLHELKSEQNETQGKLKVIEHEMAEHE